jgi:hypothetical protein
MKTIVATIMMMMLFVGTYARMIPGHDSYGSYGQYGTYGYGTNTSHELQAIVNRLFNT